MVGLSLDFIAKATKSHFVLLPQRFYYTSVLRRRSKALKIPRIKGPPEGKKALQVI